MTDFIIGKLSEIRMKAKGKDPFGPISDLVELRNACRGSREGVDFFYKKLFERAHDTWWCDFVRMFFAQEDAENKISPWDESAVRISLDGRYTVEYRNGSEVAMGAPTIGELWLCDDTKKSVKISNSAAASFVISVKSDYVAFSEWNRERKQFFKIMRLSDQMKFDVPSVFRVIQFASFRCDMVSGIDSPIHQSSIFKVKLSDVVRT